MQLLLVPSCSTPCGSPVASARCASDGHSRALPEGPLSQERPWHTREGANHPTPRCAPEDRLLAPDEWLPIDFRTTPREPAYAPGLAETAFLRSRASGSRAKQTPSTLSRCETPSPE